MGIVTSYLHPDVCFRLPVVPYMVSPYQVVIKASDNWLMNCGWFSSEQFSPQARILDRIGKQQWSVLLLAGHVGVAMLLKPTN